tara:strand:- start:582 stop:2354 length:1773 start_codon:yes stop_codon:yes gene_type:complete
MIKELNQELRNKISAGEIVERPASVVKELLENSLDAGATEIEILIEKGGQRTIQVRDNGIGMTPEELPLSILPYHTSKIKSIDDLSSIDTLGFRGEALASIASVSQFSICSSNGSNEGSRIIFEDGIPSALQPAPKIKGTEVTIHSLFYNTPARKKFLKTPRTELRKIVNIVRRYGLGFPEVSFKLISDNRNIFVLHQEDLENRIDKLLDPTYSKNLLPLTLVKGDYVFSGFVGNLNLVRKRPGEQYLFLNRRFIKDRLLNSSVYNAYESLVKRGEYPFFLINLVIPPDQVDVNVHPMKTEVRFKDEWRIFNVLKSGVSDSISGLMKTIPDFTPSINQISSELKQGGLFSNNSLNRVESSSLEETKNSDVFFSENKNFKNLERAKNYVSRLAEFPDNFDRKFEMGEIWQIHKRYIVSQIKSGLVIIDQHVAHERVLYEDALTAFESTSMASQTLLFPEVIEFSPNDFETLIDILPYLERIGFRVEKKGDYSIRIISIPSAINWGNERKVIREIIDHYIENQKKYSSHQEALAASFACKAAVKSGDELTTEEMQELVNLLFSTEHPYYCPHGRPIIIKLSLEELDKRFERI